MSSARRPSPQHRNREQALSPTQSTSRRNNTFTDPSMAAAQTKYAKFLLLQQQQQQQRPFTSSLKGKYQIAAREKTSVGSSGSSSPPPPLQPQPQPPQPHSATSSSNGSSANNIKIARRESATRAQELVAVSQGRSSPGVYDHHAHTPLYAPSSSSSVAAAASVSPPAEPSAAGSATRINVSQLRKKSVRWMNLTSTFWCLAVQDAQRSVDSAALTSFLEAMEWRARGKITDAEFTVIYAEWIGGHNAQSTRRRGAIGVFAARQLLQERNCEESDLDLLIGMIIHENNRSLLGTPVSFAGSNKAVAAAARRGGLEVVTPRWLTLSEELFFVLDTPGYGSLRFDEVFFLSTCLVIGLQGWATEGQMAADLSLEILGAHALQLMKDMGCTVTITAHRQELLGLSISRDPDDMRERSTAHLLDETAADVEPLSDATLLSGRVLSPGRASISGRMVATPSFGKFCVTLPMFKAFLVRRGVSEGSLGDLLVHVRTCVERLAHVALSGRGASSSSSSSAAVSSSSQIHRDLYLALHPAALGLGESTLGSPRLWQKTVISAAGFDLGSAAAVPPILSFLLSDAERLIPGAVRCAEGLQQRPKSAMLLSEADELHETSRRLWAAFRIWGAAQPAGAAAASSDPRSDPTYQLVLTSLLEYKASQRGLCRALLDLAMAHFGLGAATSSVAPVCLALLPTVDTILVELGMDEGDEGAGTKAPSPPSRPSNMRTPHPHSPTYPSGRFSATALQMQQVQAAMAPATEEEGVPARGRAPLRMVGPPASSAGAELGVAMGVEGSSRGPSPQRERGPATSNAGGAASAFGRPAPSGVSSGSVPRRRSRGALGGLATPFTPFTPFTPLATPAGLDNTASSIRAPGGWYDETPLPAPMRREGSGFPPQAPASARAAGQGSLAPPPQMPGAVLSAQEAELFQSLLQAREPSSQRDLLVQLRAIRGLQAQAPSSSLPLPPRPPSLPAPRAAPDAVVQSVPPAPPSVAPTAVTDETTPSSLEDLLEMGHGAGRYAQTLREILRKMSRDNNRVQLHSLEQVLKLGQQIAVLEKERPARQMRSRSPPARSPEPRDARGLAKGSGATPGTAFGRGTGARPGPGAGAGAGAYVHATPSSGGRAAWGGERPRQQTRTPRAQPPPAEKPYLEQAAQAVTSRAARRAAPGTVPLPKKAYNRGFG